MCFTPKKGAVTPQFFMRCFDRLAFGEKGEQVVADWLQQQGYTIVQRNFSCKFGEIDLIVSKEEVVAFVEVKRRFDNYFALSEVVTPGKQRRIAKTAKFFIAHQNGAERAYRFDVALVQETDAGPQVTHIENAFMVSEWSR